MDWFDNIGSFFGRMFGGGAPTPVEVFNPNGIASGILGGQSGGMMAGVPGFDPSDPGAYGGATKGDADLGGYSKKTKQPMTEEEWRKRSKELTDLGMGLLGSSSGGPMAPMMPPTPNFAPMPMAMAPAAPIHTGTTIPPAAFNLMRRFGRGGGGLLGGG